MGAEGQIKSIAIFSIVIGAAMIFVLGLFMKWFLFEGPLSYITITEISIAFSFLVFSCAYLFGGIGLLKYKGWARIALIVVSIIHLINFPIGTAIGIWFLVVLYSSEVKSLME